MSAIVRPMFDEDVVPASAEGAGARAPECRVCGGDGADWIPDGEGVRWAVRDVRVGADGVARCAYCRRADAA